MTAAFQRRFLQALGAVCAVLLLAGCDDFDLTGTAAPQQVFQADDPAMIQARSRGATSTTHVLQPGDAVRVFVFESPELSQTAVVGPDGKIRYPLVGQVTAGGRTLAQLEAALTAGLSRNFVSPQVSVTLSDLQSYQFFVQGEVTRPGQFRSDGAITIVQALALAGGLTAFASDDDIILFNPARSGGKRIVFNYDLFLRTRNQPDLFLLPGDTIIVR